MKLVLTDVPSTKYKKYGNNVAILEEFLEMNTPCVRIENPPTHYASKYSFTKGLRQAVKNSGLPVEVLFLNDTVYLVRQSIQTLNTAEDLVTAVSS